MPDAPPPAVLQRLIALALAGAALCLGLAGAVWLTRADRVPVEGWMTPRLVMLTHGLDADALEALLGPGALAPHRTIARIATDTGRDPAALVALIEAAVRSRAGAGG